MTALVQKMTDEQQALVAKRFTIQDDLTPFAAEEQRRAMAEIARIAHQYRQLLQTGLYSPLVESAGVRIARLNGLVRFEIFDQVPRKKQQRIMQYDRQLAIAAASQQRLNRIVGGATRHLDSVSARISDLAERRQALEQETARALATSRKVLRANLSALIQSDQARLQTQIADLRYDLTRLVDRPVALRLDP